MDFKSQNLLEICAFYSLAKTAARIPLNPLKQKIQQNAQPKPKQTKTARKNIELVQTKKTEKKVKPKIQQVTNRISKKSLSPTPKVPSKQPLQANNKKLDLDYFMNHMSDASFGRNNDQMQFGAPFQQDRAEYNQKQKISTQNFDTFAKHGRIHAQQFQKFGQTVKIQNNKYVNSQKENGCKPRQNRYSQYSMSQVRNLQQNSWWMNANQKAIQNFIVQPNEVPFGIPLHQYNQINDNKLNYSPCLRNYSPKVSPTLSSSWIKSSPYKNEGQISKSRTKHERKQSEQPFYDFSKLTLKEQPELFQQLKQDQLLLSHSLVSIENENLSISTNKKQQFETIKRQTSTTIAPKNPSKAQPLNKRKQINLNDDFGQPLSNLQRHPLTATQFKIKPAKA